MRNVELKGLCKSYDGKVVLKDLSAVFEPSAVHVLRGQSGSGKTTLLRILEGLEQADSGEITGLEDQRISVLFQEDRLCMNLSVLANVLLPVENKSEAIIAEVKQDLAYLDMEGCGNQVVRTLSGGMKRKVALLRALYAPSSVLFLDEPLAGLDEVSRKRVVSLVAKKRNGRLLFFVSHLNEDLSPLQEVQEYWLENGKLLKQVD